MKHAGFPLVLVVLAVSSVLWFNAPCGFWADFPTSTVPARCVMD